MLAYNKMSSRMRINAKSRLELIQVASKYPLHIEDGSLWLRTGVPHSFSNIWIAQVFEKETLGEPSSLLKFKVLGIDRASRSTYYDTSTIGYISLMASHIDAAIPSWLWPMIEKDHARVMETLLEEQRKEK